MQIGKVEDVLKVSSVMSTPLFALIFYQKSKDICYFPLILGAVIEESQIAWDRNKTMGGKS